MKTYIWVFWKTLRQERASAVKLYVASGGNWCRCIGLRVVAGQTYFLNMFLQTLLTFSVAAIYFQSAHCFFVNIDANAEECFFDKVTSGTKMSLMFEVAEGGFLDIDIKVYTCNIRCSNVKHMSQFYAVGSTMKQALWCKNSSFFEMQGWYRTAYLSYNFVTW